MLHYVDTIENITARQLSGGFFEGWQNPPDPATHLRILQNSYRVWLTIDDRSDQVVGFINAISDGVLSAFIPLLEVLPGYRQMDIGTELTRRMLASLSHLYSVDLVCDMTVRPFYERLGGRAYTAMIWRNRENQSGS